MPEVGAAVGEALNRGDAVDCPECLVRMVLDDEKGKPKLNYAEGYKKSKTEKSYSDQAFGSYD